jgi:hypothetical protein
MNTKFPLLVAAGLLVTVATTQAQNNYSKKYAANYPAHTSATMNKPGNVNREDKSSDRPFQKNANKGHQQTGKHHHHHHGGHHK